MDVNFSPTAFSPPHVKAEPAAPALFLDTHLPSEGRKRGSRPPTGRASPSTPFHGPSSARPLATPGAGPSTLPNTNNVVPGAGGQERYGSAAPSIPPRPDDPEEGEGEDGQDEARLEDEVYKAQQAAQGRAKANLKVLMDHFSEEQQTRYDWYRRSTLNKGNVRKLIQSTGTLVTPQVAQMVAGVGKVFVGEVVERALEVQAMRGEQGALTPEHLRQAYQMYRDDKGMVGAARPLRGKRMAL